MLLVDPETLESIETDAPVGEYVVIDGIKFYSLDQRIFAVIIYRIRRAEEAFKAKGLETGALRIFARRFYHIANWANREFGAEWIAQAEMEAEKQLKAREKQHAA